MSASRFEGKHPPAPWPKARPQGPFLWLCPLEVPNEVMAPEAQMDGWSLDNEDKTQADFHAAQRAEPTAETTTGKP